MHSVYMYAQCLPVVHSVYRLYSGKRVCAQCLQTMHSVYKLCTVSTCMHSVCSVYRLYVYAYTKCIRSVQVYAYTCIRVYTYISGVWVCGMWVCGCVGVSVGVWHLGV